MSVIIKSTLAARSASPSLVNGHSPFRRPGVVADRQRPEARADEIAAISHELRNSLAVVRNAAHLLRHPDGVEGARVLIERHVGQMKRHIDDLLDASHRDVHLKMLHRSHVDLRTIVQFSVSAITPDLALRGHRLAVNLPSEPLWMEVDALRLEQVFSNLLINAAKYTPDGGEITLSLESLEASVSIRIRDTGIGIDASELRRIFDMFVRAESKAPFAEDGSGIGLAVVRELVEMHGGSVQAASAGLGRGSEFTVLLPSEWLPE